MMKSGFGASGSALLAALMIAGHTQAQTVPTYFEEGCVLLGELVRQSVVHELRQEFGETAYPGTQPAVDFNGLQSCTSTAPVASWAFATAFGQFGMPVRWSYLPSAVGTTCPDSDLRHCQPFADPMGPPPTVTELALIGDSWQRARGDIIATMPFGPASGVSYFESDTFTHGPGVAGPLLPGSGTIGDGF